MPIKNFKELAQEIAKRLTAMRLQHAWTREDLASRSGINIYTLKHFERTGQISLERLIALCDQMDILPELERVFKPRLRINADDPQSAQQEQQLRKRGRRKTKNYVHNEAAELVTETE